MMDHQLLKNQQPSKKLKTISKIIYSIFESIRLRNMQSAFVKIQKSHQRYHYIKFRITKAVAGIYRYHQYTHQFETFQRLKQFIIAYHSEKVEYMRGIIHQMQNSALKLIISLIKKKIRMNKKSFLKILINASRKNKMNQTVCSKAILKIILKIIRNTKRSSWLTIKKTSFKMQRNHYCRSMANIVKSYRIHNLNSAFWGLKLHLYIDKTHYYEQEVAQLEEKLRKSEIQSQLQSISETKEKVMAQLSELEQQQARNNETYQQQLKQLEQNKTNLESQVQQLQLANKKIQQNIAEAQQRIDERYSMQEIYQFMYNNLLMYLHHNQIPVGGYSRNKLLFCLHQPLLPMQLNSEQLLEQNQIMKLLIQEYIVIFGKKSITVDNEQLEIPYDLLLQNNFKLKSIVKQLLQKVKFSNQFMKSRQIIENIEHNITQMTHDQN